MAEFAINDAMQETPFMLNYGQHPLNFMSLQTHSHVPAATEFTENMLRGTVRAKSCLGSAQQRQKAFADKSRCNVTYAIGEQVLLNSKNLRDRCPGCPKLMPRWIGPYKVLKEVGNVSYQLELPRELRLLTPVFHVSLLQPWRADGRLQPPPPRLLMDGQLVWTIDRILDHRSGKRKNLKEFLIRWEGFDQSQDSWEPEACIHDPQIVQGYWDYVASCDQHTEQQAKQTV